MLEPYQHIPDVRSRRTGVYEIAGGLERNARIELTQRALDIASAELRALDRARIHERAGIGRGPVGAVRSRREYRETLVGAQRPRQREREMRVPPAAAAACGQFHRGLTAPHEAVRVRRAQRFDELAR